MLPQGPFTIFDLTLAPNLNMLEVLEQFLDAEAIPFIVRRKDLNESDYLTHIEKLSELQHEFDFDFLVHHHVEALRQSGAVGIHLTASSTDIAEVREEFGNNVIIGYSAHSIEDGIQAKQKGADYLFFGSLYETPKSHPHPEVTIDDLRELCKKVEVPVYAVGGINSTNLMPIADAGAAGFSALRAIYENNEIEHNISKLGFLWEEII